MNTAYQKANNSEMFSSSDLRGKLPPANKLTSVEVQKIKNHIESFPLTESHYYRKSSQKMYLDSKLSIAKMHSLYEELCVNYNEKPVSKTTYKRIFCKEYNYSFFKPKKDKCSFCTRSEKSATEEKGTLVEEYTHHKERIK